MMTFHIWWADVSEVTSLCVAQLLPAAAVGASQRDGSELPAASPRLRNEPANQTGVWGVGPEPSGPLHVQGEWRHGILNMATWEDGGGTGVYPPILKVWLF